MRKFYHGFIQVVQFVALYAFGIPVGRAVSSSPTEYKLKETIGEITVYTETKRRSNA